MTNPNGRFGIHGGQYIPETLMNAVIELEKAYNFYKNDEQFNKELSELLNDYAGRPSRLYFAKKMTEDLGGAKIYLKREDLNHTGAQVSTELRPLPQLLLWVCSASFLWAKRTPSVRRSTFTVCVCSALR